MLPSDGDRSRLGLEVRPVLWEPLQRPLELSKQVGLVCRVEKLKQQFQCC